MTLGANGGSGGDAYVTATYGQKLPKRTMPRRNGWTFAGFWDTLKPGGKMYYDANGNGVRALDVAGNITLWAKWSEIETDPVPPVVEPAKIYTIRLDNNGGSGAIDDMTADSGAELALPLCTFTAPRGKKFGSWNTKADGSGVAYADKTSFTHIAKGDNEIVILYAQWIEKDAHRIIYIDPQNVTSTQIVSFKEREDVTLITPQAAIGYGFKGWYLTDSPAESDEAVMAGQQELKLMM